MKSHVKLIEVTRNSIVESEHFGSIVIDTHGLGQPEELMYPRSSLKLFQAASVLALGVELTPEQTAIAAASHSGEGVHLEVVAGLLRHYGLSPTDLRCTPRLPLGTEPRNVALRQGIAENSLMSDCSGKHSAFLAACVVNNWPRDGYLDPGHPLQVAIRSSIESWLQIGITITGVDGCGAPVFAMSLMDLARGFALALHSESELGAVAKAMMAHPYLVGGAKRLATEVMQSLPGSIAKDGAEGVFVLAHPKTVVAIKVSDGSIRPHAPIVKRVLTHLGISADLTSQTPLGGGNRVGELRPSAELSDFMSLRLQ